MASEHDRKESEHLPVSVTKFIEQLLKKMRYRRKARAEVGAELAAHFEDELSGCAEDEREKKASRLIADFGDPKLLGVLMRRAKKRCRPFWQKALVRSLQVLGIFVLYLFVCSIPLFVGKPTLSVDYVEWLNNFVRNGRDEADNARPYYEKACELNVEMLKWLADNMSSWPTDFNDADSKLLTDWLQDNRQSIEMLRKGSDRAGYWAKYRADATRLDKDLVANAMEILPGYRRLAFTMRWQIRSQACDGEIEAALNDTIALVKFGGHLQGHGLLIEQLVGIAIEAIATSEIFRLIERFDVPADILKDTYRQLESHSNRQKPIVSLEAEKVFWYDAIQRGFTDDGQGNGRVLARGLAYVVTDDWEVNLWRALTFDFPDRKEMMAEVDRYFAKFTDVLGETPWELHNEPAEKQEADVGVKIVPVMLEHNRPSYTRVSEITARMKTDRRALLVVIATMRYKKAKGRYPAVLDELVGAGYLKKLPVDPYSNKPLMYKKTGDDFILYSVGPNFKDDGGISGTGREGRPRQWADDGDTIFWPVSVQRVKPQQ